MALPDSPQQQLDWEARHRLRAAIAAAVAALGILVGQILEQVVVSGSPRLPLLEGLQKLAEPGTVRDQPAAQVAVAQFVDDHAVEIIGARVVTAIGFFALAYALTFLAAAVRARRPQFPRWAFYLPIVGGVLFGVAWVAYGIGRVEDANSLLSGPGPSTRSRTSARPASPGSARCCCSPRRSRSRSASCWSRSTRCGPAC